MTLPISPGNHQWKRSQLNALFLEKDIANIPQLFERVKTHRTWLLAVKTLGILLKDEEESDIAITDGPKTPRLCRATQRIQLLLSVLGHLVAMSTRSQTELWDICHRY